MSLFKKRFCRNQKNCCYRFEESVVFFQKHGPKRTCFSLGAQGFGLRFKALALACSTLAPERFSLVADTRTSPGRLHMAALPDLAAPAELDAMLEATITCPRWRSHAPCRPVGSTPTRTLEQPERTVQRHHTLWHRQRSRRGGPPVVGAAGKGPCPHGPSAWAARRPPFVPRCPVQVSGLGGVHRAPATRTGSLRACRSAVRR